MSGEILPQDWTLLPQDETPLEISITDEKATVVNGRIRAEIDGSGCVRYLNEKGDVLLQELWIGPSTNNADLVHGRNYKCVGGNLYESSVLFKAQDGERFHGMGQYANGMFDLKGSVLELAQKNTQISIPFLISSRGYGFMWNNPSIGRAELAGNHTGWFSEGCRQLDYLVIAGETPRDIEERYTSLVGRAPMLPGYGAGFWQCKLRYRTQEELLDVARQYKKRNLPVSVIVIDFFHWPMQGEWRFDPRYWPDPKAMVDELEGMGIKLMVSIWPTVDIRSDSFREMEERGLVLRSEHNEPVFMTFRGACTHFDATNEDARRYVWKKARDNYYSYGICNFWLDEAEPEMRRYDQENARYSIGNGTEVGNIYPFYYAKTFYEGLKSEGREVMNLIRCAWHGSARYGVVVWSGDIPSTFESLRNQVKAGLNMSLCGIPWWTTDIGGFYGGDGDDPRFRELLVRWFQFGVFCPIFRLHGCRKVHGMETDMNDDDVMNLNGGPNEAWSFGQDNYEIIRDLLFLRERMRPYIMKQMKEAHESGTPVMRPLFFDYPGDADAAGIWDEYMFGPDVLVAPVLYEGMRRRRVYLPGGCSWKGYSTGRVYEGGQWFEVDCPVSVMPVFERKN